MAGNVMDDKPKSTEHEERPRVYERSRCRFCGSAKLTTVHSGPQGEGGNMSDDSAEETDRGVLKIQVPAPSCLCGCSLFANFNNKKLLGETVKQTYATCCKCGRRVRIRLVGKFFV